MADSDYTASMNCFACGRKLGRNPALVDTRDGQTAHVGAECFRLVKAAGETGYQPPLGGPRLYLIATGLSQLELSDLHRRCRR